MLDEIPNKGVDHSELLTFEVSATDPDDDALTYAAAGLPTGATFSGQTFSWTPTLDQAGTHYVTFTVSDKSLTDSRVVTIAVSDSAAPSVDRSVTRGGRDSDPGQQPGGPARSGHGDRGRRRGCEDRARR